MSTPSAIAATTRWAELEAAHVSHVLADLGLAQDQVTLPGDEPHGGRAGALFALEAGVRARDEIVGEVARLAELALDEHGALLLFLYGRRGERELAATRNALWPRFHVGALYFQDAGGTVRRTLQGETPVAGGPAKVSRTHSGVLLAARRTRAVLSPGSTVEKFDQNAAGWNGRPGTPGYAHFRWMRRHVARFARAREGARVLDFGCGAGWVGIEAARRLGAAELCAFDPSSEMVAIAERNAAAEGIARFTGRTGFGEEPPFPGPNEEPFELVLSSGVVSFAPDPERWIDGLAATVAPGGELVIGDIQRESRGFRRRRLERALLPVRELNARTHEEVRAMLEARGFTCLAAAGYQLTRPVPELMHLDQERLGGLFSRPLLWTNQLAAATDQALGGRCPGAFDSWMLRLARPRGGR